MSSMTPKAVAEAYKGKYKPIVSSECPTCKKAGIANSVFYYCDSRRKDGKGRCMFCAYLAKPEKRQLTEAEFFQVDEHDFSFVHGMACRSCGDSRRIATEATANELGASLRGCLSCAITKAQNAATVRQARDFGQEVNRAYWKFAVDSVSRGKYVEIMTNDPYEIQQVKSLVRQCKLMNEYEKAGGSETRYELDHVVPVTGTAEIKGRTIADNLRIIIDTENRSKSDTMPTSYTAKQVISVRDLEAVNSWSEASKRLKRYLASDAIPEATIERIKATATALKADVDALAQRIGENAVKAILESHERNIKDFGFRSLESILEETKRHI
ncbi:hypothetical protein SQV88_004439, partial [Salmonella enterica]|nr:hypothetical protein [Salmonella enterica]